MTSPSEPKTSESEQTNGLSEETKQQIRDALQAFAETPGFRPRATQRKMIAEVSKTLAGDYDGERVLCVEGPTGTGKSLAYLLPAIPVAQARGKTVVISTATVALQEQLVDKDLPGLQDKAGLEFSYALAKGRKRYVCDRNLERLAGVDDGQNQLGLGDDADHANAQWHFKPRKGEVEQVEKLRQARQNNDWNGDFDTWSGSIRTEVRDEITTDQAGCTGKNCPFQSRCAFITARRERQQKDVIVANHALVVADLMLGGGAILPEPADCIYVFDEGHHLPGVAVDQGACQTRLVGPQKWLTELTGIPGRAANALRRQQKLAESATEIGGEFPDLVKRLNEALSNLHRSLKDCHPALTGEASSRPNRNARYEAHVWRFAHGVVPENLRLLFEQAHAICESVCDWASKLRDRIRKGAEAEPDNPEIDTVQANLQWLIKRLDDTKQALAWLSTAPGEASNGPPVARWIEVEDEGRDFLCCATPTSAAGLLRSILWPECDGAILTSATLTSLGRFERLFEQTGLGAKHGTQSLRLASPFDYTHNARLVVPAVKASPKVHADHTQEVIERIDGGLLDKQGGSLVLFASYRQMNDVADGVDPDIEDRILVQGSGPRQQLMRTHRERVDAGEGSILFGVSSFSEGLDLPGDYCSHVVIVKLPFSVPTSPVEAARSEWLDANNRNPFMEMAVPDASLKLLQATGRLLRAEDDIGRVTVLDRRLADMPYGRMMMDALPPFRREIEPK